MNPTVVMVIPAYKPEQVLLELVADLQARGCAPLVLVDDGSGPEFEPVFQQLPLSQEVVLLRHPQNRGKGAALKTAMAYIQEHFPDVLGCTTLDADGQHRVEDVLRISDELRRHPDSLILGVRSFTRSGVPLRSRVGNLVTRFVFFALVGRFIRDTQTGLRAIPLSFFAELIALEPDRYEYELEVLLACRKKPLRQLTIETVYIDQNRSSHFSPVRDSLRIYQTLIRCRWKSLLRVLGLAR